MALRVRGRQVAQGRTVLPPSVLVLLSVCAGRAGVSCVSACVFACGGMAPKRACCGYAFCANAPLFFAFTFMPLTRAHAHSPHALLHSTSLFLLHFLPDVGLFGMSLNGAF